MRSTGDVLAELIGVASVEVASVPDERLRSEVLELVRAVNVVQAAVGGV